MSEPRTYEQLFDARMGREPGRSDARLLTLERRIAELTAEIERRDSELAGTRAELAESKRGSEDLVRRMKTTAARQRATGEELRGAALERDAALREVARGIETIDGLRARVSAEAETIDGLRVEVSAAAETIDGLRAKVSAGAETIDGLRVEVSAGAEAERQLADRATRAEETASEYASRVRELEQLVSALSGGLAQTKVDIDRAAASKAWRWGHGTTKTLRRLVLQKDKTEGALARALNRIEQIEAARGALPAEDVSPPSQEVVVPIAIDMRSEEERASARAALAAEIRERLGPVPTLSSWPAVSIVTPTRNGLEHIERLVAGLQERTDYPEFELIVVDNASEDGTRDFLDGLATEFPLAVIANSEPASFSDSNDQGTARAAHDLILFLNNDIEPFERGWLRELVAAQLREGVVATGATLLRSVAADDPVARDRTVQHRSIKFRAAADGVRPCNHGDRDDLFGSGFGTEDRAPAVTAACMLVDKARVDAVGGFTSGYRFGTEDVDLALKLTAGGGHALATGRSILYHRESPTQDDEGRDFKRNNRVANRRLFLERWGAQVRRDYRLGRLRGDPFWTDGSGPHVAITVTSLDPGDGWGDWYTAHEFGDALAELGWRVTYVQRKADAWYELPADLDYMLALMDPFDLRRVPPEVTTIAWVRNWTDRWLGQPWFGRADVILASSGPSQRLIEEATGRHVTHFPLATNPSRFAPQPPDPARGADYVFTGNHWGEDREIQPGLAPRRKERLDIYGRGWDKVKGLAAHARGPVPYGELPAIYSSAKLVLDDTAGPTLPYGAVNARVFDALAAGTLPLTNCEAGVRELFGEDFPVWTSAESLRVQLDDLLGDDDRRAAMAERFRGEVLRHHTFAHRARRLSEVLVEYEERPSFCLKIGAPTWEEAERWGDLHFARALERELRGRGHRCLIQVLEEWENDEGLTYDVALVIRGLSRNFLKPGQFNVLWVISHPAEVTGEECDGYDLVCVASESFAAVLAEKSATPVVVLEQATDPTVFFPDPSPEYEHDLVYVANSRNVLRPIVRDLLPTDHDLAIYGSNWEGLIDTKYVVAEYVPNDELRKVYSSAKIVLCDHWDDMREHGFISNRIYDALACGATIVSDDVEGLAKRFPDLVHTYRNPDELKNLIAKLLAAERNPDAGSAAMFGETFAVRAEMLLGYIRAGRDSVSVQSPEIGLHEPEPT
jgi:O-antigen biosynthesis protein